MPKKCKTCKMAHPDLANYCMVCGYPFEENDPNLSNDRPSVDIKCPRCKETFKITNTNRPLKTECPKCGQVGILRGKG